MANTIDATTLIDGSKRRVIHLYIAGDASGQETDTVIYDFSADTQAGTAGDYKVTRIWYQIDNFELKLEFDGATDFPIWKLSGVTEGDMDWRDFGGIGDNSTTPTGDVTITTVGLGANEEATLIIELLKS